MGGLRIGRPDSYIVKVSGTCNLACSYCNYFLSKGGFAERGYILDLDLFKKLMYEAAQIVNESKRIWLIWHGGEPLLAGLDYFNSVTAAQEDISTAYGIYFRNSVQTNGTLINRSWAQFFKKSGFSVGVSLDGPPSVHNLHRTYKDGLGSFSKTICGVKTLQDEGIPVGVLAVVTKGGLSKEAEIFDFFVNLGITAFDFLPCAATPGSDVAEGNHFAISPLEWASFAIRIFDLWVKRDDPDIRIRYLENILTGLLGGTPNYCKFDGSCSEYVTIDSNGMMYPCDNFIGLEGASFGNLRDESLTTLLSCAARKSFTRTVAILDTNCEECIYLSICKGGCARYKLNFYPKHPAPNYYCSARKALYMHAREFLERIVPNFRFPSQNSHNH